MQHPIKCCQRLCQFQLIKNAHPQIIRYLTAVLGAFAKSDAQAVAAGVARARLRVTALEVGSLELSGGAHGGSQAGRDADGGDESDEDGGELHFGGFSLVGFFLSRIGSLLDQIAIDLIGRY